MSDEEEIKIWIFKNFIKQNFSLPSGIIYYITHTPSSSKGYQKLQQTCKYYYFKKQLIIFDNFKWSAMQKACRNHMYLIDLENSAYKIWLTKELTIYGQNDEDFITSLMPRIYKSNISTLKLCYHNISFKDYKILSENVHYLTINDSMIVKDDGTFLPLEEMIELLPKLYYLFCSFSSNNELFYTSQTAKKLTELSQFLSLNKVFFYGVSALFNPIHFCQFVENYENANFFINFCPTVSIESYDNFIAALEEACVNYKAANNNISINDITSF
uniref:DUF3822 family protein n=1 Tax=Panagrolaimus sp. PS1159 TaxID=55785 RepID=A0AC35FCZ9_9BILA